MDHPELSWCDFHAKPHAKANFQVTPDRPIGVHNLCRDAVAFHAAEKRAKPQRRCPACDTDRASWYFRGGRAKSPICRDCEEAHPEERWCIDCPGWLPRQEFYRTGVDGRFLTVRCKVCRLANNHGVSRALLRELNGGSDTPRCAACGSLDDIKIDHDHEHCPSHRGCSECVRGYLCHQCNTAEGLLRTPERARQLAAYMERQASGFARR